MFGVVSHNNLDGRRPTYAKMLRHNRKEINCNLRERNACFGFHSYIITISGTNDNLKADRGVMIGKTLVIAILVSGIASQYSQGVMMSVARTRQAGLTAYSLPMQIPSRVSGFIAVVDCQRIGEIVRVRYNEYDEYLMVADCSGHQETTNWMERNNIIMEIGYETALRWGVVGRGARVQVVHEMRRYDFE